MSGDHHMHHASTLVHVPAFLLEQGINPGPVFRSVGISLSTIFEPDGWFPRENALALANAAERLSGDLFIGPRQAAKYRLEHLGAWGQTVADSPDLRAALNFACTSVTMLESGTRLEIEQTSRTVRFHFGFLGRMGASPRQHIDASLAVLRKIVEVTGTEHIALRSSRESSRGVAELEAFFGPDLGFGADSDYLEFDRDLMDCPLGRPLDSDAAAYLETVQRLRDLIGKMLPYGRPTIEGAARRMQTSVRTLQRRLRDFGLTYEEMLDDIRYGAALDLISARSASVTETAFLLGYSDVAHFTRAFRRWTGMSPRQFARRRLGKEWPDPD